VKIGCISLIAGGLTATTLIVWLAAALEGWLAALLTYGAQTLYVQTLHELGDLRVAFERAQKLDDLKDQFIRNVNHELRNPIMALYSNLDMLRLGEAQLSTEKRSELLDRALRVSDRVLFLVTSILETPQYDHGAGNYTPQSVAVAPTVRAAAELIDPRESQLQERDLRLDIPTGLSIRGDPVYLQQIITNLLSNAVKYSADGTPIEVSARLITTRAPHTTGATTQPMIAITVRDYGHGIDREEIPLLFQRFVRLPRDLASNIIGNGLGLYLCRVLSEAMGGRIWVESAGVDGEGAAFHVELPAGA
jgi:signal transduction histidine kinase